MQDGLKRIRAHNAKLAAAAANVEKFSHAQSRRRVGMAAARSSATSKGAAASSMAHQRIGLATVKGDQKDLEAGAALFGVAASPAGAVLPQLDELAGRGRSEAAVEPR